MIATVPSAVLLGVDGAPVTVEVHVSNGIPGFTVVGHPDAVCREARDRVRAALMSSGFSWPSQRMTVNLAPSGWRKVGAGLDLAMGLALLVASGQIKPHLIDGLGALGELGLDGTIRPVAGMVPLAAAVEAHTLVVPPSQRAQAEVVGRRHVRAASTLAELVAALSGQGEWAPPSPRPSEVAPSPVPELADVRGQAMARWALEVAAAGGHHLLMTGPPGAGKSMLATRLIGLLPPLEQTQALATTRVHSAAGMLSDHEALIARPPFLAPHHRASAVSLLGGGSPTLRPGVISLAHNGVLFLDEASNGKCTSFSKEVTDEDDYEPAWRERAAGAGDAGGGLPGVHSDGAGHAGRGHAADLPVSAAVEVSQGQGGRDRASAP